MGLNGHFVSLRRAVSQLVPEKASFTARSDRQIENQGNQEASFWADTTSRLVENLSTTHVVDSLHCRTHVYRRDGSGGKHLLCAGILALAVERSGQVRLLSDCGIAGVIPQSGPAWIEATLSVNFLFTLLGILEIGFPETLLIGLASTLAQFYWRPARRLKLVQLVFNLSQVTVSSAVAYGAYKLVAIHVLHAPGPLALLGAAVTHFACNSAAMSSHHRADRR